MIYNCLALTHTVTATDINTDSKIISLSSQFKLYEIKKNIYSTIVKLGKLFVFHWNVCRTQHFWIFEEISSIRGQCFASTGRTAKAYCKFPEPYLSPTNMQWKSVCPLIYLHLPWLTDCLCLPRTELSGEKMCVCGLICISRPLVPNGGVLFRL